MTDGDSGDDATERTDATGTWEPRPVPNVNPETEPFWEAAAEGRFLVRECSDCGLVYYYPRALCPDCFSDDVEWLETDGEGEIYSFSTAYRMEGWPEEDLPLVVAYVELDEGPRVMTNVVDCDPDALAIGDRVEARFVDTEEGIGIPVFAPLE